MDDSTQQQDIPTMKNVSSELYGLEGPTHNENNMSMSPQGSTPISCLSNDTLFEIFQYFRHVSTKSPEICRMAVVVSHVCRRWRMVAVDNPLLWTLIYYQSSAPKSGLFLDLYLRRSIPCPLDISVCLYASSMIGNFTADIENLVCHISRWSCLNIKGLHHLTSGLLEPLARLGAPNLKRLDYTPQELGPFPRFLLKDKTPRLTSVRLEASGLPCFQLSFSALTTLTLYERTKSRVDFYRLYHALRECTSLRQLELIDVNIRMSTPVDKARHPPIKMPMLTPLKLHGHAMGFYTELSAFIRAPKLTYLEFKLIFNCKCYSNLQIPIPGRFPSLKTWVTLGLKKSTEAMYLSFPSITSLECNDTDNAMELLSKTKSKLLCPNLTSITIRVNQGLNAEAAIRALVSARMDACIPLVDVHLKMQNDWVLSPTFFKWLGKHVDLEVSHFRPESLVISKNYGVWLSTW